MSRSRGGLGHRRQRGVVLFVALILLLVLTILAIAMARTQTTEERLSTNEVNHQEALQTAEATLQAAFDDDIAGIYVDFSGQTMGLNSLSNELNTTGVPIAVSSTFSAGVDAIAYNGAALASKPTSAAPAFVIEAMAPTVPPGCLLGNAGNVGSSTVYVHRITARSTGGDATSNATVQTLHIGAC